MSPANELFAGTLNGGVFRSIDGGNSWNQASGGLTNPNVTCFAVGLSNEIFAGTYGGLFCTTNSGKSWREINVGIADPYISTIYVTAWGRLFVGVWNTSGGGIYRSTDDGASWTTANTGIMTTGILSFAEDPSGLLYTGTNIGIFSSVDNGAHWIRTDYGMLQANAWPQINCLTLDLSGHVLAGSDWGLFCSTNQGGTWKEVIRGYFNALAVNFPGHIFVGSRYRVSGVHRSTDGGTTWTAVTKGLSDTSVVCLGVDEYGYLFAGTEHGGIFRSVHSTSSVSGGSGLAPATLRLYQNYPNPFNPSTNIRFEIADGGYVSLRVFDLLGREVATIANELLQPGTYERSWEAHGYPSGTYFCRLSISDPGRTSGNPSVRTRTLLLLK